MNNMKRATRAGFATVRFGALALSLAGGCSEEDDSAVGVQSPVIAGTATAAHSEVGKFRGPSLAGVVHNCTAVLIGPREVLTASHCIADQSGPSSGGWSVANLQLQSPSNTFFDIDIPTPCVSLLECPNEFYCDTANGVCARTYQVERIFPLGLQGGSNDLAVGKLTEIVPASVAAPAQVSTTQPSNTFLTLMGYGCVAYVNGGGGTKRFKTYFYDGSNSFNTCSGDSGGPTFLGRLFDNGSIVRITSTGGQGFADGGADAVVNRNQIVGLVNAMETGGISYRSQVQVIGFTPAVTNGQTSGTMGQSLRLEGIQIWSSTPGVVPAYRAHVQDIGWQKEVSDGQLAGTVGQSLRMEALQIRLAQRGPYAHVQYRAYVQNIGFQPWITDGQSCTVNSQCTTNLCADGTCAAGTTGRSLRIEAIQIRVF